MDLNPQADWLEDMDLNPLLSLPLQLLALIFQPQLVAPEARLVCRLFRQAFDAAVQRITVRVGTCDSAGARVAHLWRVTARMPALAAVSLDLAWCGLGDGGMKELAAALCGGPSLSSPTACPRSPLLLDLDLSYNGIRELGAAHLAAALSSPVFLARVRALRLNVGHNSLAVDDADDADGGAVLLAEALRSPAMAQRLVALDLWGTRLYVGGLTAMAATLQASSSRSGSLSALQELKLTDADYDGIFHSDVNLEGMDKVCLALQGATHLRGLRSLAVGCGSWDTHDEDEDEDGDLAARLASAVCASPHLASLEELQMDVQMSEAGVAFAAALGQATHLARLRVLDLRYFVDGASLAAALAAGTHLAALEQLRLGKSYIRSSGAVAFADAIRDSAHLSRLRVLSLDNCHIGPAGAHALAEALEAAGHLSSLEELRLPHNQFSKLGVARLAQALAAATHLARLRVLDLSSSVWDDRTTLAGGMLQLLGDALLVGTHLSSLRALHLNDLASTCQDSESLVAALRSATHLSGLQVLELRGTCSTGQVLTLLQPGSPLTGVQELRLAGDLGRAVCALQHLHLPNLQGLRLRLASLGCAEELCMALPGAAHLRTLTRLEFSAPGHWGREGVAMLVEALHAAQHLTALRTLSFEFDNDVYLSYATWARIGALVGAPHMSCLRELELPYRGPDEPLCSRFVDPLPACLVAALPIGGTGRLRIVTRARTVLHAWQGGPP